MGNAQMELCSIGAFDRVSLPDRAKKDRSKIFRLLSICGRLARHGVDGAKASVTAKGPSPCNISF
jgi:hypothetical protein